MNDGVKRYRQISRFLPWLFSAASIGLGADESRSQDAAGTMPALTSLQQLLGKSTSSAEFAEIQRQCALKLVGRSERVDLLPPPTPRPRPFRPPLRVEWVYGGSGLVLTASALVHLEIGGDLTTVSSLSELVIGRVQLIVGPCRQAEEFGRWRGEMPGLDLPRDPTSMRQRHDNPDSDLLEVNYGNGGRFERGRKRVINYAAPWRSNNPFPYAFTFENDQLTLIDLLPPHRPGQIVSPQPLDVSKEIGR